MLIPFEIELDSIGKSTVKIDGMNVSASVAEIHLASAVGQPTVVTLVHVGGSPKITGEGIIHVSGKPDKLGDFVRSLSPAKIEQEALDRQEWGSSDSMFKDVLEVIASMLDAS